MPKYRYEIHGTAHGGQTWKTSGEVETANMGAFLEVPGLATRDTFMQLTHGKAIFGQPGIGCHGPYTMTRMLIEEQ